MRQMLPVAVAVALLATSVAGATLLAEQAPSSAPTSVMGPMRAGDARHHAADDAASVSALCDAARRTLPADSPPVPTKADALLTLDRIGAVRIAGDREFNPAHGVRSGSGTAADPFVISGFYFDTLVINDTSAWYDIRGNWIGALVLDWNGAGGWVRGNHIDSLQTNQNVRRTGDATATVIVDNEIVKVKQLRHFDGVVARNVIGDPLNPQQGVSFNIAGFNGAEIHDNTIYGAVDMKLHGHHHSSRECGATHNHGSTEARLAEAQKMDHSIRYIHFRFDHNTISDPLGLGLRYNDLDHAGDDRTATSEEEPDLAKPHTHYTTVRIDNNTIDGATLLVQIFDAPDELHLPGEHGRLVVENNTVKDPLMGDGLVLQSVRDASVLLRGNSAVRGPVHLSGAEGIRLEKFRNSTIVVASNSVSDFTYGVYARDFDALTHWRVLGNAMSGVKTPVYWDSTVKNPPEGQGAPAHDHPHDATEDAPALVETDRWLAAVPKP